MKNLKFLFLAGIILTSVLFITCENTEDSNKQISLKMAHLGGCNIQDSLRLGDSKSNSQDSIAFSITDDTLDVFVGINFLCCAGFDAESKNEADTITISLTDTCKSGQDCYCKCECFYIWDFMFVDFQKKYYYFRIVLNSQTLSTPRIIQEGLLNLKDVK